MAQKGFGYQGLQLFMGGISSPPSKPLRPIEVLADCDSEVNLEQMVRRGGGVVGNEYQLQPLYNTVRRALVYYYNFSFIRFTQEES